MWFCQTFTHAFIFISFPCAWWLKWNLLAFLFATNELQEVCAARSPDRIRHPLPAYVMCCLYMRAPRKFIRTSINLLAHCELSMWHMHATYTYLAMYYKKKRFNLQHVRPSYILYFWYLNCIIIRFSNACAMQRIL